MQGLSQGVRGSQVGRQMQTAFWLTPWSSSGDNGCLSEVVVAFCQFRDWALQYRVGSQYWASTNTG